MDGMVLMDVLLEWDVHLVIMSEYYTTLFIVSHQLEDKEVFHLIILHIIMEDLAGVGSGIGSTRAGNYNISLHI